MHHTSRHRRLATKAIAMLAVTAVALAACGSDDDDSTATTAGSSATTGPGGSPSALSLCDASKAPAQLTKVKLQLQWYFQAQFAGYLAAAEKGCYKAAGLDVQFLEGAADITPQEVLANGQADFAVAWVPKALQTREKGADIVNIAQIFQRSGTLQVSFKEKGITSVAGFKGKTIGNWGFGNEFEIFAALSKANLDPAKDVKLVAQQFDMNGLLRGDIDAAEAMIYNEYAQVLEAKNTKTGKLYTADDLNVISYEDEGVGMLQDALWARGSKLSDPAFKATATAFVKASLLGWIHCRDHAEECRDITVKRGSKLGASHQLWQMNEVNGLIWQGTDTIGVISEEAWKRTIQIAQQAKNLDGKTVLTKAPDATAYTNDIVDAALSEINEAGIDVSGSEWKKLVVTLQEGGN